MNPAATPQVGDVLPALKLPPISRTMLALFAGASGDHNPIHIDTDVARSAGFDDVFCHGMLSMAYLGRLITNWIPQTRLRSFDVRFKSITPVHGEPNCHGEVIAISRDPSGQLIATLDLKVALADGTPTLIGSATVVVEESN